MANFQNKKLPVSNVTGVNDNPLYDSAQGVNGTKMILDFNSFVDAVETEFNALSGGNSLTSNVTYYVSPSGNDSNDGLTVGTPFLTIKKAFDRLKTTNLNDFNVTIQLADGTYNETANGDEIDLISTFPSQYWNNGANSVKNLITIQGNSSNKDAVILNCVIWSDYGVNGYYIFKDLTIHYNSYHLFESRSNSLTVTFDNIVFKNSGSNSYNAISIYGGTNVKIQNAVTFQGTFLNAFLVQEQANLSLNCPITFVSGLVFNESFIRVEDSANALFSSSLSFTGTFTGYKYVIGSKCSVRDDYGFLNNIPGTIDGWLKQERVAYKVTSTTYTALIHDRYIEIDNAGDINLPSASQANYPVLLTIINSSVSTVSINASSEQYIGNTGTNNSYSLASGSSVNLISNPVTGNRWRIV